LTRQDWRQVVTRTWHESSSDNIGIVAAGVSFYAFLALMPLLASVVLIYGLAADPADVIENVREFSGMMPREVAKLIAEQLMYVVTSAAEKKGLGLFTALALSLVGARAAAGAVVMALNIAYEAEERRGWFAVNTTALLITMGGVLFCVFGLFASASLALIEEAATFDRSVVAIVGKIASNATSALCVAAVAAALYRFGPCRARAGWRWVAPGAVLFAIVWAGLTLLFGIYIDHFGSYGATYGALATVIVFLTWMYLASYALLLGAELNSEIERQMGVGAPAEGPASEGPVSPPSTNP
jgi:membrane protein